MYKFKSWKIKRTIKQHDFQNIKELKEHYQDLLHLQKSVNRDLKRIKRVLGEF